NFKFLVAKNRTKLFLLLCNTSCLSSCSVLVERSTSKAKPQANKQSKMETHVVDPPWLPENPRLRSAQRWFAFPCRRLLCQGFVKVQKNKAYFKRFQVLTFCPQLCRLSIADDVSTARTITPARDW